jgi:hypothetical protein
MDSRPGDTNKALSRDTDISDADLTTLRRSSSASPQLRNQSTPGRNQLMADLATSAAAISKAVTESISEKSTAAWFRWQSYLRQIVIEDIFLSSFFPEDRWDVLVGFSSALRGGRFQRGKRKGIVQGSISDSLGAVAHTFLNHRHDDPRLYKQGNTAFILLRTLKGLKGDGPPPRKQAPATPELIRLLASSTEPYPSTMPSTNWHTAPTFTHAHLRAPQSLRLSKDKASTTGGFTLSCRISRDQSQLPPKFSTATQSI